MLVGFVCYGLIMVGVAGVIRGQTGVVLDPLKFNMVMLWALGGVNRVRRAGGGGSRHQGLPHARG